MSTISISNVARLVAVLVLSALSACKSAECCGPADCKAHLTGPDLAGVLANGDAWLKAVRAADWSAMAATYAPDAILMPPNGPVVTGRPAIFDWFGAFPPLVSMDVEEVEVEGCCDLAYVRGTYRLEAKLPGGASLREKGKYLEIHRKQPDGTWLKSHDMFSSDEPAPQ